VNRILHDRGQRRFSRFGFAQQPSRSKATRSSWRMTDAPASPAPLEQAVRSRDPRSHDAGTRRTPGNQVDARQRRPDARVDLDRARPGRRQKSAVLRLGADDYVTKPFGVLELLAPHRGVAPSDAAHTAGGAAGCDLGGRRRGSGITHRAPRRKSENAAGAQRVRLAVGARRGEWRGGEPRSPDESCVGIWCRHPQPHCRHAHRRASTEARAERLRRRFTSSP